MSGQRRLDPDARRGGLRLPGAVCLWGFMGAGKSTLGAALAERLGSPFVDLDGRIEAAQGRSIPEIFAAEGEGAFRVMEAEALSEVLAGPACVLACGGGTPTLPGAVERMSQWGLTVYLDAPLELLAGRVAGGAGRPKWGPGVAALYAARRPIYRKAELVIDASSGLEEQLARALSALGEAP